MSRVRWIRPRRASGPASRWATYFLELARDRRRRPADDMIGRLTEVEVDRGDGQMTGLDDAEIAGLPLLLGGAGAETVTKLVGNAAVLFHRNPEQYAQGRGGARAGPGRGGGDPAVLPALPVPGAVLGAGTRSTAGSPSRPGTPPSSSPDPPHGTSASTNGPTTSTSTGRPVWPSGSDTGSTAAWAPRWPGWRAASPSRNWRADGRGSRSTKPRAPGSTCPTWPGTPTSRSTARAEEGSAGGHRSFHCVGHRQPDRCGVLPIGHAVLGHGHRIFVLVDLGPVGVIQLVEGEARLQ